LEAAVLHLTSKMRGFHIVASDGEIGHVDDFVIDPGSWAIRYMVVDTSNWIGGKSVLISPSVISAVDSADGEIQVKMSRAQIEQSPSVETADIELIETVPSVWIL
jgi:sporulation protein YlmC with PRC-barrel domain